MTSIEDEHVYKVYRNISEHFSDTRFCIWNFVKKFLDTKNENMIGVDIGCGNGKNICYNNLLKIDGFDNCRNFVEICREKGLNVKIGNCLNLPSQSNRYDFAMAVAVFHHMASDEHRINAIKEMIRTLKSGGKGIFSVWSVENQETEKIKRNFVPGDNYVKWRRKRDGEIFQRYYYVYTKEMIIFMMANFKEQIKDINIFNERGNWVVEFIKL
tara:strand:+ start:11792 stop:12430 length:639 start_codon:yes stop_codon:yes gene_type:complete